MTDQDQQLSDAVKRLLCRLVLLDTAGDSILELARQSEIAVVEFVDDLLALRSNLTRRGRAYVARQLECHQRWLDDLEARNEGRQS